DRAISLLLSTAESFLAQARGEKNTHPLRSAISNGRRSLAGRSQTPIRIRRLPPPPVTPAPTATAKEPEKEQQHHGADGVHDDRRDDATADADAEMRQQPAANKGADDTDGDVADQPEAAAGDELARQPSGNEADQQDDE